MQRRPLVTFAFSSAALAAPGLMRNASAQESGVTSKTLGIGCSAPVSGPLAGLTHDSRLGMEAAVAHINRRGGIFGRMLQLNITDDAYVPQRTVDNVKQMIAQGNAFVLLSCAGTPNNQALLPLVEEAGIPYVAPLTGASSLRKSLRNVFHVRASYTDEIRRLVQRLAGMGLTGVGVVFLDNGFGRELLEDATHAMAEQRIKPQVQAALTVDGKNLGEVLDKVAQARPAAVLLATVGSASVALVRGLKKNHPGLLMAGTSVALSGDEIKQLGKAGSGIAVTMVVPDAHLAKIPLVRDYQSAMRASNHRVFTQRSLETYINLRVLAEGLERAGAALTRAKLRDALASIRNWDMGGFVIDYASQPPYVGSRFVDLGVFSGTGRFLT
ncbi:ABC transporter substrate-binding protein [Verminephrobacter eiseniae]|uniref:Extracellular ligand-binding receptor n=1 Tax=Verminephrobacter eiseniae (strain EF01-2) TaxID=391735 RepID=A1WFC7_VEREI|nr:ABC transporter substrate-binding protein [Verminephrobacter eiseniae]ABM56334.1 extracellular ligand-binding receptor [Verminephrobacter eiseniae EF01-2]MCW5286696.1 ABC transporter substrate-binding protein [Verminephrobacter eiseniae]MCW5304993.1 ABC transporter substrate-binding protein [Verminephrobacter eiseniae]MCW8181503.1 ABC transporter substrate-binding protein [Verminephrobacter eiseniae]MCW8192683.1 ABC transporter substrate-binding protein [Verminephrobacter eiseniae]